MTQEEFVDVFLLENDILKRLDLIYDFSKDNIDFLLNNYKNIFTDINEYKTLLIVTKNMKFDKRRRNLKRDYKSVCEVENIKPI